jgi:hypothetical protein
MISKQKTKLIIAAIFGILLSFGFIFLIAKNINNPTAIESSARTRSDVVVSVTSISRNQVRSQTIPTVYVKLTPNTGQLVSAVSLRLTFSYQGQQKPIVTTPQINQALIQDNWTFPINTVSYNDVNQMVTIDISGLNLTTSGYSLAGPTDIASFNFNSLTYVPFFHFDTNLTKLVSKQGVPLKLSFSY